MDKLRIVDANDEEFFKKAEDFQSDTTNQTMETPKESNVKGMHGRGCVLQVTKTTGLGANKVTMFKYLVVLTGTWKPEDVPAEIGAWESPFTVLANRMEQHKMNVVEREIYSQTKPIGNRAWSDPAADGTSYFCVPQIIEFKAFGQNKWMVSGRGVRRGDFLLFKNLRWEDRCGNESKENTFEPKNENIELLNELPEFEQVEKLAYIAQEVADWQSLAHTDYTSKMSYPSRIDRCIALAKDHYATEPFLQERRYFQATVEQQKFIRAALCIPLVETDTSRPLARAFQHVFNRMTVTTRENASQKEPGRKSTEVEGTFFLMRPSFVGDKDSERIAVHVEMERDALAGLGVRNGAVKKALVPQMLQAARNGFMWCEVDAPKSTVNQAVPVDPETEQPLADYGVFIKCKAFMVDHVSMVRDVAFPASEALAKAIFAIPLQKEQREYYGNGHPLQHGDDVYNASEVVGTLDFDDYDYFVSAPQYTVLNVRKFHKIAAENNMPPEQARDAVSLYLQGKGGLRGEKLFGEEFAPAKWSDENTPVLWGIKKTAKPRELTLSVEEEAALIKRFVAWRSTLDFNPARGGEIPAAAPLSIEAPPAAQPAPAAVARVVSENNDDASDASESKKKRAASGKGGAAKRTKLVKD